MLSGLASLAQALQGGPEEEEEVVEGQEAEQGPDEGSSGGNPEDGQGSEAGAAAASGAEQARGGPALSSFWGVASALTATVKAKTAEVLTAVQETDWRAELEAFQQGAKEDAAAVGKGADIVVHRAREAAEHLPGSAAALQAKAGVAGQVAKDKAEKGLASLAGLGSKIVLGTHDLFEQISHAVQNELALTEQDVNAAMRSQSSKSLAGQARYSRFDADVAAMQRDSSTYCDEPEDGEAFEAWLAGFDLAGRRPDIERLIAENTFMSELQARIVPLIVEYDAFWTRYFYRLHRLEQKHAQFVELTQRTLAAQEQEEVGWSSDEEEQEQPLAAAASPTAAATASAGVADAVAEEAPHEAAAGSPPGAAAPAEPAPAAPAPAEPEQQQPVAAVDAPLGDSEQAVAAAHGSAAPSAEASPAATVSSDGSVASGEHWQVVSPRKQAAAAAAAVAVQQQQDEQEQPAEPAGAEEAAAASPSKAAEKPAAKPAAAAEAVQPAAAAAPVAAASAAAAVDEEELSDWGDDDDAALDAAAAAGAAGGASVGEWGSDSDSDWE